MNRRLAVWALGFAIACVATAIPAPGKADAGGHAGAHAASTAHGTTGATRSAGVPSSLSAQATAARPGPGTIVTRPAPPLRRAFDDDLRGHHHHHHHLGPGFVFVEPGFLPPDPFFAPYAAYPYPYASFYTMGPAQAYTAPSVVISAPFFCWIDGIGFNDEEKFAQHLHEAHGVPQNQALSMSELVGGRYVFFGW